MGKRENIDTKCQKVLELLIFYKRNPSRVFDLAKDFQPLLDGAVKNHLMTGGWLPIWAFTKPYVGGSSGGRRKRDLHGKFNIPVEKKTYKWWYRGREMRTPVYRLGCDPEEIDLKNIRRIKKEKYEQGVLIYISAKKG